MEIKILVKENEKSELDKFIETCKEYGMQLIREGGGKLPNFSGYYAELKGVRWQKADTGEGQYNILAVSVSKRKVCPQCKREFDHTEVSSGIFCCYACEHGY